MTKVRAHLEVYEAERVSFLATVADTAAGSTRTAGTHYTTAISAFRGASAGIWGCQVSGLADDARSYTLLDNVTTPIDESINVNVILWAGQSNARGVDTDVAWTPDASTDGYRHFYSLAYAWQAFDAEPSHLLPTVDSIQNSAAGFSSALRCVEQLCLARPGEHWAIVPAAIGGSTQANWARATTRGTHYGQAWSRARHALRRANTTLRAIYWYQGESDAETEAAANAYATNCQALFDDFRSDFGLPNLPIIYARILASHSATYTSTVRTQQALLQQSSPPQIMIDPPAGAEYLYDATHLNQAGHLILGSTAAVAIDGAL
jgi:hypothetical protein